MIVTKMFPLSESSEFIVHLESMDWDFQRFGRVKLVLPHKSVSCRYVGFGTQSDEAVLKLRLEDGSEDSVETIVRGFAEAVGPIHLISIDD